MSREIGEGDNQLAVELDESQEDDDRRAEETHGPAEELREI